MLRWSSWMIRFDYLLFAIIKEDLSGRKNTGQLIATVQIFRLSPRAFIMTSCL